MTKRKMIERKEKRRKLVAKQRVLARRDNLKKKEDEKKKEEEHSKFLKKEIQQRSVLNLTEEDFVENLNSNLAYLEKRKKELQDEELFKEKIAMESAEQDFETIEEKTKFLSEKIMENKKQT